MQTSRPVPRITIRPASPEEDAVELCSNIPSPQADDDEDDGYRHRYLHAPIIAPSRLEDKLPKHLSPLHPEESLASTGLERERFERLLKASREREALIGSRKSLDLRKQIAIKAHRTKQVERRAIFLSKISALPSPTAICLPKTPPESPAIFHYTLPSPGLNSPIDVFRSFSDENYLSDDSCYTRQSWIEQVQFRLPKDVPCKSAKKASLSELLGKPMRASKSAKRPPSLEEITNRLAPEVRSRLPREDAAKFGMLQSRLPAFLLSKRSAANAVVASNTGGRAKVTVGRLHIPVRSLSPKFERGSENNILAPDSPGKPLTPKLQVTTTVLPHSSASRSISALSEANLNALGRETTAREMIRTLRRRASLSLPLRESLRTTGQSAMEAKRLSSPAELQKQWERSGFGHEVLSLRGGF